jgi:5'-phosphate synthase pdxT subunit
LEGPVTVGVLALQGDVREHLGALAELDVAARTVRRPADLEGVDGVVLPGGESTTLSLLLQSSGLFDPLARAISAGLPTLGTCAGLVLLARDVQGGRPDQRGFSALDCVVLRNGYGRQVESFEATVELSGPLGAGTMPGVFIRAPLIESVGPDVEVLGWVRRPSDRRHPVICRQGNVIGAAFHPELTSDRRLHRLFARTVASWEFEATRDGAVMGLAAASATNLARPSG